MRQLLERFSPLEGAGIACLAIALLAPFSCWRMPSGQNRTIELRFLGRPEVFPVYQRATLAFERLHPDVRIKATSIAGSRTGVKALLAMQAGSCGDIVGIHWSDMSSFAPKGVLVPLNELIERDWFDIDDFFPGAVTCAKQFNPNGVGFTSPGSARNERHLG